MTESTPDGCKQNKDLIINYMYLGLLPFFIGAFGPWVLAGYENGFIEFFILYSSIILVFLSGALWGMALFVLREQTTKHLHWAIVCSLIPLAAHMLPVMWQTSLLLLGFLSLLFWEKLFFSTVYPAWYQQFRHRITFIAAACHMLTLWNIIHP
jgi:hypothetical protein